MDPLVLFVFGIVGFVIGFLASFFRRLPLVWAIFIFYILATAFFLVCTALQGESRLSEIFTFHTFGTAFIYCVFGNTLGGLPIFLLSRWFFLKLNLFKQ